jgi:hypothetical protein
MDRDTFADLSAIAAVIFGFVTLLTLMWNF